MCGDPHISTTLRIPFLAWIGNRTNKSALESVGIDPRVGSGWLTGRILPEQEQRKVIRVLAEAGRLPEGVTL